MTTPSKKLDDIRDVGIVRVPTGSFLITGRPRIRSAWLAALLSCGNVPVYHEAPLPKAPIDEKLSFGLVDSGAACLWPNKALQLYAGHTIIIIERPEKDCRASLERLVGQEAKHWDLLEERYQFFKSRSGATIVQFDSLNEWGGVQPLVEYLIHVRITRQRFQLFDGLRVEQDFRKAQQREAAAA